ncbi:SDR family oxidoreductase [Cesiribacter sp. SM1]|uniref:SDR family oxidoreductase n=1 Tax=Cesiribacter sp. SM1 TaxID=2861196 RepID=UPI001CD6560C|nr:SDR family oxidoreductase [Cesiribacter sp. SM1]
MKKVILFGATGHVGQEIARELKQQGYQLTVVVRNGSKAEQLSYLAANTVIADVTKPASLSGICNGHSIVVSALGKSVSPNDNSRQTFYDIDFLGNRNILREAKNSGVKKFVYLSAFHSEKYLSLSYFKVHHEFSEVLKASGIDYSIIKPPAVFSAFTDVIELAKKGRLVTIGAGDKKTNPIYEGDLARICVEAIGEHNATIEAGGKTIYTRKQLNDIVQKTVNPGRKALHMPIALVKTMLPLVKLYDKNMYDKAAFIVEVMQHDTIAPRMGELSFEDYIQTKASS